MSNPGRIPVLEILPGFCAFFEFKLSVIQLMFCPKKIIFETKLQRLSEYRTSSVLKWSKSA